MPTAFDPVSEQRLLFAFTFADGRKESGESFVGLLEVVEGIASDDWPLAIVTL
jgi:hypothetical protein